MMQFESRSKEMVLVDLSEKLRSLSTSHPDYAVLTRMIRDLRSEISERPTMTSAPSAAHS
jgi:hypothetical protein